MLTSCVQPFQLTIEREIKGAKRVEHLLTQSHQDPPCTTRKAFLTGLRGRVAILRKMSQLTVGLTGEGMCAQGTLHHFKKKFRNGAVSGNRTRIISLEG